MKILDITKLSLNYTVRAMTRENIPEIYALGRSNPLFEKYCGGTMTEERIEQDLIITPPETSADDKYYVGYYDGNSLVALLDLVVGYPDSRLAFIGLFMVHGSFSGQGVGTGLVGEICTHLKNEGFAAVRLAYAKDNPQASHFWIKNGFVALSEVRQDGGEYIVAERVL